MSEDVAQSDPNQLVAQRRQKLKQLREQGGPAFPNQFRPDASATSLQQRCADLDKAALEAEPVRARLAGRLVLKRVMGKASFFQLRDGSGDLQLYMQRNALGEALYERCRALDIGDIIGVEGQLFRTRTGELTLNVEHCVVLVKSLRPLPEKFHGLTDQEARYRQRYVDLIVNTETRETFRRRSRLIQGLREFFVARDFLEVETPMMHPIPGGATARPFITHHNALDTDLYLRIAPELYLKRLVVGGFERVFEINRNFRNEGLSPRHNPEFTMLEFYQAYADYRDLISLTHELLRDLSQRVCGSTQCLYQGVTLNFAAEPLKLDLCEAILHYNRDITAQHIEDIDFLRNWLRQHDLEISPSAGLGALQLEVFENTVEHCLIQPTFITGYPLEVSPLARASDDDPTRCDRFELFIAGREMANGFSELNDPEDQARRFRQQVADKDAGNAEAMHFDDDYIRALEYGLPPTAGEGIGVDRLAMLFCDAPTIRDVLLFPQLRRSVLSD